MRTISLLKSDLMKALISALILILILTFQVYCAFAQDYEKYMEEWNDKRELATKYLLEAEEDLKIGNKASSCEKQRKAGTYGIKATKSLMEAMKLNGSTYGLENIESGLRKWEELRDFCG